ncbi:MAG: metal-dependent hydrolase [Bacteroidota bacterium]
MASSFGHALASYTIGKGITGRKMPLRFWLIGIGLSIFPDLDVLAFNLGIPYSHPFGHRGFTHSILFALLIGILCGQLAFQGSKWKFDRWWISTYFVLAALSHGLLDAMTTGGRGVGFFIPIDNSRFFLPFRPIQVAPLGVEAFFSSWGMAVLASEAIWIGIPCLVLLLFFFGFRRMRKGSD